MKASATKTKEKIGEGHLWEDFSTSAQNWASKVGIIHTYICVYTYV